MAVLLERQGLKTRPKCTSADSAYLGALHVNLGNLVAWARAVSPSQIEPKLA